MKRRLAIFDNDGTVCDTQEVEGRCFAEAIEQVTGKRLASLDWSHYNEPTGSAIVRELLSGEAGVAEKEAAVKAEFLRRLQRERPEFPGDFSPIPGAVEFIQRLLAEEGVTVAIATGCFYPTAEFKLQCCGLALGRFPHATACDTPRRCDIIRLAVERAGFDLSAAVYFADGAWDIRASRELGIPMIGIGRRHAELRRLGLPHVFCDYSEPDRILEAMGDRAS